MIQSIIIQYRIDPSPICSYFASCIAYIHVYFYSSLLTTSGNLLRTPSTGNGDLSNHLNKNHVLSSFSNHQLGNGPVPLLNPLSSATSTSILESGVIRSDTETVSGVSGLGGMGGSLSPSLTPPASPPVSRSTPTTPDLNNRRRNKK